MPDTLLAIYGACLTKPWVNCKLQVVKVRVDILQVEVWTSTRLVSYF